MIILKQAARLQERLRQEREKGHRIGFVPTMGALHQGHLSLISTARSHTDITVCSIFVNPTQFNDPADFEKYPVTIEKDIDLLVSAGTDILFLPSVAEMYPDGWQDLEQYDLGYLETVLEGASRPGHFQGVCQVVSRLLRLVAPDQLFMGRKDYQQCMVVKRLLTIMQSNIELVPCPTLRQADGLAMSSRNMRLSPEDRQRATAIHQALDTLRQQLIPGPLQPLKEQAIRFLQDQGFRPDYVEIADADTLELVGQWDGRQPLVGLVAAFLGEIRLIDNMLLTIMR
ncbi:MAG: pantoate--beta-alanine ligase [Candidatus Pseudobacter hemicellulosilyticus]|uniref:Pantothenate synthetase n=1 Tax=Candidatus Pseudobacter hemicellulosilyticus TaxID=3121375 RepID=A0AAJ5WSC1_9BACT|nr:MAG: pantoate--beta-alanine ligase [Pseudobacter sp.]